LHWPFFSIILDRVLVKHISWWLNSSEAMFGGGGGQGGPFSMGIMIAFLHNGGTNVLKMWLNNCT
jgi:hypothetical protein